MDRLSQEFGIDLLFAQSRLYLDYVMIRALNQAGSGF